MEQALQCSRWPHIMKSQRFIQVNQYLWVPPTKTFLKLHWQINIQIILWYKKFTKLYLKKITIYTLFTSHLITLHFFQCYCKHICNIHNYKPLFYFQPQCHHTSLWIYFSSEQANHMRVFWSHKQLFKKTHFAKPDKCHKFRHYSYIKLILISLIFFFLHSVLFLKKMQDLYRWFCPLI